MFTQQTTLAPVRRHNPSFFSFFKQKQISTLAMNGGHFFPCPFEMNSFSIQNVLIKKTSGSDNWNEDTFCFHSASELSDANIS